MINGKKVIAIATARGGSKGIPRKNTRPLLGKPLIAYVLRAARYSGYVDRVLLTTDDSDIAVVGRELGVEVPFIRPKELAEDDTPDTPVFQHAVEWLEEQEGYEPDIIVHLRPTGPMLTSEDIDSALELLEEHPDADSVRSVKEPPWPPFKMWRMKGESCFLEPLIREVIGDDGSVIKDAHTHPRQLLPTVWQTTPDVHAFRLSTLLEKGSTVGENVLPFEMTHPVVDVDEPRDFEEAERLMSERLRGLWRCYR